MKEIEYLDISGDVGLRLRAGSLEELFEAAAEGMAGLITDTSALGESEQKEVVIPAGRGDDVLIAWLNELVFLFDAYGFIGRDFRVTFHKGELRASVSGGTFNPAVNERNLLIKAATYHNLCLKKINSHWEATVVFDI